MDRGQLDADIARLVTRLQSADAPAGSALLYGSVVRGDWIATRSDVNLLLVMDDASPAGLRRLAGAVSEWHRAGHTAPLIIGREEWQRSVDVFPIEMTDMQLAYRLLHGTDPLADVRVAPSDLRRALESELRGKLVRLRQAYVRFGESMVTLGGFATASVGQLLVLFRCTGALLGRPMGATAAETIAGLADVLGEDAAVITEIAGHRAEPEWHCPPATFARYLEVVHRAVEFIDHYPQGDA
ncbi:MAG: nucleotidyltransferase domain-containing protein [Gemmatimonadetes bacterium]|nr:nucleotidyltransferase domain-containing protein [Gemmatimonadota bacterium]